MDLTDVESWIARYRAAWASDDPADIRVTFTDDATYSTDPFDDPWVGIDTIVEKWIEGGDSQTGWEFAHEVLAIDGDLAVIEGRTTYTDDGRRYANIWLVRFAPDGRARDFREFYMAPRA